MTQYHVVVQRNGLMIEQGPLLDTEGQGLDAFDATVFDYGTDGGKGRADVETTVQLMHGYDLMAEATIPMSDLITPEPTRTPTLVLVGKIGPQFGNTVTTVKVNGTRHRATSSDADMSRRVALANAQNDYATAVAS